MNITIEQFRELAVKSGMAKFQLKEETIPREDMFIIGADFLTKLHANLVSELTADEEEIIRLRTALYSISNIEDEEYGGDWEEIDQARTIAKNALNYQAYSALAYHYEQT